MGMVTSVTTEQEPGAHSEFDDWAADDANERAKAREMVESVGVVGDQIRALEKHRKPVADRLKQWLGLNNDSLDVDGQRHVFRGNGGYSAHLQERKGRAAIDFKEVVALPGGPDSIVEMALAGIVSFDEAAFERWREVPGSDVKRHLIDVIERNMQRADPTYALIVEKGK
mgnify:CR=1 FL=1